jgi:hypothetical protein
LVADAIQLGRLCGWNRGAGRWQQVLAWLPRQRLDHRGLFLRGGRPQQTKTFQLQMVMQAGGRIVYGFGGRTGDLHLVGKMVGNPDGGGQYGIDDQAIRQADGDGGVSYALQASGENTIRGAR